MDFLFYKICFYLFFVNIIRAQTPVPSCLIKDNEHDFCESPGYPNGYQKGDCVCEYSVPVGFQIAVMIQDMDLDSSTQDYVTIIGGNADIIYKFSWFLTPTTSQPASFYVDKSKVVINFHADKDSDPKNRGFKILLTQYGELTTTEQATTENILPTPVANDSIYHTVYLDTQPNNFKKKENEFKDFLVNITNQFVVKHEMDVLEPITQNNIKIQFAKQCSYQWPNSDHCTEIMYAVPIVRNSTNYELSAKNLKKIWNEFGQKNLEDHMDLNEYTPPNNTYNMLLWLVLSLIVLVAFLAFLFFMKVLSFRLSTHKRRLSDTDQIMANSNRNSDASLWPMSSQIVPPLFDNESPYVYYEPDPVRNSVINSQLQPTANKTIMNVDDMSDDEILTVPNRSGNSNQKPIIKFDNDVNRESAL